MRPNKCERLLRRVNAVRSGHSSETMIKKNAKQARLKKRLGKFLKIPRMIWLIRNNSNSFFTLLLLLLSPLSLSQTFEFIEVAGRPSGEYFKDVAVGDVYNDGDLDIWGVKLQDPDALTDIGDSIFINQLIETGTMTFVRKNNAFPNPIQTKRTYDSEFADVNNDGNLDLVRSDEFDVQIVFGSGNGVFDGASAIQLTTGLMIDDVVLGDLNQDGFLDVVCAEYNSGRGSKVFLNLGQAPWFENGQDHFQEVDEGDTTSSTRHS